jgi:hypothetical protein
MHLRVWRGYPSGHRHYPGQQWGICFAGSSFSDEVGGNRRREELVSTNCRSRMKKSVQCIDSFNNTYRCVFCPTFFTGW